MPSPTRYEAILTKQLMNRVTARSMPFGWSINPYRGCQHGCSFCYARATHTFLGMEADDQFQKHILLKQNAAESLRQQLGRMLKSKSRREIGLIAIGTATDPYQQIEGKAQITKQVLQVLAEFDLPVAITTRSPLILRDIPILQQFSDIRINLSINTLNKAIWKQFEPSSPAPEGRMQTLGKLREAGIHAGVFLAPILPMISDKLDELDDLLTQAAKLGANFIEPSVLRLSTQEVKGWFFATLREHYPQLMSWYGSSYFRSRQAPESYRKSIVSALKKRIAELGLEPIKASRPAEPEQLAFTF